MSTWEAAAIRKGGKGFFFSRWWFEMYLMRAPRGSVPDIREVTAVGVGICGRSVVRVWAKWGGGEAAAAAAWWEEGRKGEESLRLCRAIWRYSGKGYKFHREQIDKRLLYGSLRFFHSAHLVAAGTQSRDFYRRHRGPVYCLIVRVLPARDSPRRFKSIYKRGKVLIVRGHPSSNDLPVRLLAWLIDNFYLGWY